MPVKRGKDGRFAPNGGRVRDKGKAKGKKKPISKSGFDRWMGAKKRTDAKTAAKGKISEAGFNRWADAKKRVESRKK
ncbi:hypothetical protein SEA_ROSIEPOSIE_7 [Arthrobacter phage RosiePosie]|uniref:Uncharacterized protein n=14 Tax=Klausavirus princesstrina TaxID=1984784 RepID=A0A286N420_9CAUD|nr:hypothetical protein FDI82_gp007 [Arthrobacter phage PrincessTrina]ANU79610.1 hypothetical protein SEA_CONBOY_7 [Arthrobacter phage Conboy]AOZ64561.1 hypothetical protein SEA_CHUBSTER_7 [Arthrobacter phage Chubster]AOZ64673.1 hypothetical protein SEA_CHOCOLAT_7 [Arthrobacter phage Chocolat]APC44691.1 hypothetical protein SEA_EDGARPOE_7 [Arthrobacter phage EdgarPoe]APC44802.1 hypothetical protein SEA_HUMPTYDUMPTY_7 [Arthrobacter phage HumptyDumpty]ASX98792.1 hypothetical protein SEA_KABREEZ